MTASRAERPVRPTITVETEVDVDPRELEAQGWVYIGTDDKATALARAASPAATRIVEHWHDRNHTGPWPWCPDELCREVVDAERAAR